MDIKVFLDAYGLLALFLVMLAKSAGVPIPIPADVLMLATSARVATGRMALPAAFIALLVALVVGGVVQFGVMRRVGRKLIHGYGRVFGLTVERVDTAAKRLERAGALGIGVAVLTPGVRSIAVAACGLAGISLRKFVTGLAVGSAGFVALHFALGISAGVAVNALGEEITPGVVVVGFVLLLAVGLLVWYLIRRRQSPKAPASQILAEAVGAWHEATCPVCLALGAAERLQIQLAIEHHHE